MGVYLMADQVRLCGGVLTYDKRNKFFRFSDVFPFFLVLFLLDFICSFLVF